MSTLITKLKPPEPVGPPQAIIYLRVSTKEQAEKDGDQGYSIPAQREACWRKAQSLGAEVVEEFLDAGESARSADRPELQRLLTYVADHRPAYVIVHKVDRLARNRADDVMINVALQQAGVILVSCSENIDQTPSGALLHGIMASIAEFYSRNLATEALKGMTQKAQQGGTVGKAPIGYSNVRKRVEGREVNTVEPDPARAGLIKWAFKAFATGEWTLLSMCKELAEQGLLTQPTRTRAAKPLSLSRLQAMLRNRYYLGKVVFKGAEYDGTHPGLVDLKTFNDVQAVLDAHRFGEKQRTHPHYLKSSVVCGLCGSRLCITRTINRFGSEYLYFFCLGRQRKRTTCTFRATLVSTVEELVEQEWGKVKLDPEYAVLLQELVTAELRKQEAANARTELKVSRQLERKRAERQKLLEAWYHQAITIDLFKNEQLRLTREIEGLELKLVSSRLKIANLETVLVRSLAFLENPQAVYHDAPPALRRQLNQAVFEHFEVYPEDQLEGSVAEPFRTLIQPDLITVPKELQALASSWDNGKPGWFGSHPVYARTVRRTPTTGVVGALGLKENDLVPPTGFEPVPPP